MKKAELTRIGFYLDRLVAEGPVLTGAERLELGDLLKKWLAEVAEEPSTVSAPSSWGDIRRQYKA